MSLVADDAWGTIGLHGFSFLAATDEARHTVCIHGTNVGPGSDAQVGGCGVILRYGDLNGDDAVSCADLAVVQAAYGQTGGGGGAADVNGDGKVDIVDLSIILSRIDSGPTPCP